MHEYQPIDRDSLSQKLKILMILRVAVATTLLGSQIIFHINDESKNLAPLILIIATYLLTILYGIYHTKVKDQITFTYLQLIGDLSLETGIIYTTGGTDSPFTFLYLITIITSGMMLFEHSSFILAGFSSLFYTGTLVYNSYLETAKYGFSLKDMNLHLFPKFYDLSLNIFAFFFVALLASYFAGTVIITGQKLKETHDDLSELQSFTENILQSMHSGLVTIDLEGKISYINAAAEKITCFKGKTLIGQRWNYIFDSPHIGEILKKNFKSISLYGQIESNIIHKDLKTMIPVGMSISPLLDESQKVSGLIVIFKDLTEIRRLKEEMRRSDKLAALGHLSAGLAHEIRNPLASMSGSVQLLLDESGQSIKNLELMEIIVRECDRLNKILSDFLMFAKPKSPNFTECDISSIISDTIQLIKNQIRSEKVPEIVFHSNPDKIIVPLDIDMIKQVIWNLLQNSIQSMSDNGRLAVMVVDRNSPEYIDIDPILELDGEFQNILDKSSIDEYIEIYIKDNGCGIQKKEFKRIFDPFYTTKDEGSGLGLAIAHKIIESHRGKIYVESANNKGTIFKIFLSSNHESLDQMKESELEDKDEEKVEVT